MPDSRQLVHHVEHLLDHLRVERGGRLVEEHDLRLHRERAGDRDALLLAAGELARGTCAPARGCARARAAPSPVPRPPSAASRRTCRGASVMFSSTVRCGKRLNCWKTIPTSRRISWMLRRSSESSMPSTTIRPRSCFSSRLMQRISVDLPEPDGPQTTTTSCRSIARSTSLSAWKSPNHFSTPLELDHAPCRSRCARAHRSPTPSRRSSRWLSRDIQYDPTQYTKLTKTSVSTYRPCARKSGCLVMFCATASSSRQPDDEDERRVLVAG